MMKSTYTFPVATHSYFRAINRDAERARFVSSADKSSPTFVYPKYFNLETVAARQMQVHTDSDEYKALEIVLSGVRLQKDVNELAHFRELNSAAFGMPDSGYAKMILTRILSRTSSKTDVYAKEVLDLLGNPRLSSERIGPSHEIFQLYKDYFSKYRVAKSGTKLNTEDAIKAELVHSGLDQKGWELQMLVGNSHARVNHNAKKVRIGEHYVPRSPRAAERIAVHEVYGHALRGCQVSTGESEGFAILLEQLLDDVFKPRRSYRYLAACIGWGIFGTPKSFAETFEVMWRLMVIGSGYSKRDARMHAFDECYRVYRGGSPDLAGAVYLKDTVYFASNIAMWKLLSNQKLSYNEFVDIIEGRRALLI